MIFHFDPSSGLVVVRSRLIGPSGMCIVSLALDTGATRTLVNASVLVSIGIDPPSSPRRVEITTGSGVEFASDVFVDSILCLGIEREGFSILCHTLPPSAGVDGLLGLDFLRELRLTIEFPTGTITVDRHNV